MKYRLTVLTPLLVGDGRALSPIDYMVWKDQVNVLDQERIFRLLARGPRLDPYLSQLRRAEKLDFASWGGFAQNFAGRRIPFEHPSLSAIWQGAPAELLHIPTFSSGTAGPFVPGSAIKGALRTGYLFTRWNEALIKEIAERAESERGLRRPGIAAESMTAGSSADPMRLVSVGDSMPVPRSHFMVYLVRVAKLQQRAPNTWELGWKQAPRGTAPANRPELATPAFGEMAVPGTEFTGRWTENEFLRRPEIARALHWKNSHDSAAILRSANSYAEHLLNATAAYAGAARLDRVAEVAGKLKGELDAAREQPGSCLLSLGWGGGFLTKSAAPNPSDENYRRLLRQLPFYAQAIKTGLPFPKTRRVVFQSGEPATLPGWVRLELY